MLLVLLSHSKSVERLGTKKIEWREAFCMEELNVECGLMKEKKTLLWWEEGPFI
jgi:hypothetical protein